MGSGSARDTGQRAGQRRVTATIGDVAAAAGVSRATVSRVMNGRSTVDAAIADLLRAERDILAGVSDADQGQLAGLLRRLILGLGD